MKNIEIQYVVGYQAKPLRIKFTSHGIGQIRMDRNYHSQAVFQQGQWHVYLADRGELNNSDDIQILVEILTKRSQ